jgi:formylglycine-generating enzyme required for sulfatase activity
MGAPPGNGDGARPFDGRARSSDGRLEPSASVYVEPATGMRFVEVPAGHFVMGSPESEVDREAQETRHDVILSHAFWLGQYEVTQEQWRRVMGTAPSHFAGAAANLPVENVNWFEVGEFLRRLAAISPGNRFRLPTEAEWEYACRGGTRTAFASGEGLTPADANIAATPETAAAGKTMPVGSFAPNAWQIYDLHGNVWEWTADEYCPYAGGPVTDPTPGCGAALKVIHGGSWRFLADSARCALRYTHRPQDRGPSLGFRIVREGLDDGPAARRDRP